MKLGTTTKAPAEEQRVASNSFFGWLFSDRTTNRRPTLRSHAVRARRRCAGFSLEEVVVSMAISAISIAGISSGYIMSAQRAAWSGCSQAANSMALQRIEQVRAAKWDTLAYPSVDEVVSVNFPVVVQPLDLPTSGTNVVYGTNVTTISTISVNPPIKMIHCECTWRFMERGLFTNSITLYRSPDQ